MDKQTRKYSSSCRIENWFEDVMLEEDALKNFLEKRERGELYIQKVGKLMDNVSSNCSLTISTDGYLHFGDLVQLRNSGATANLVNLGRAKQRGPCTLGVAITDQLLYAKTLSSAAASASACTDVTARSILKVVSVDGTPDGHKVVFGQPFQLVTHESLGKSVLLSSDNATFGKAAKKSRHQLVEFTDENTFLTHWRAEHFNPQLRLEFDQSPVPVHSQVIIKHCKTNTCLAVEENYCSAGFLGMEFEISTHTYLDDHRAERDVNHWMFHTQVPPGATVVEEPKPEDYPKNLKD